MPTTGFSPTRKRKETMSFRTLSSLALFAIVSSILLSSSSNSSNSNSNSNSNRFLVAANIVIAPRHCHGSVRHLHLAVGNDPSRSMTVSFASTWAFPDRVAPVAGVFVGTVPPPHYDSSSGDSTTTSTTTTSNTDYTEFLASSTFYPEQEEPITYTIYMQHKKPDQGLYYAPYQHHISVEGLEPDTTYYYLPVLGDREKGIDTLEEHSRGHFARASVKSKLNEQQQEGNPMALDIQTEAKLTKEQQVLIEEEVEANGNGNGSGNGNNNGNGNDRHHYHHHHHHHRSRRYLSRGSSQQHYEYDEAYLGRDYDANTEIVEIDPSAPLWDANGRRLSPPPYDPTGIACIDAGKIRSFRTAPEEANGNGNGNGNGNRNHNQTERPVAVKVMHPRVEDDIDADLDILRLAVYTLETIGFGPIRNLRWLNLPGFIDEMATMLKIQLDLRQEGKHLVQFNENFANNPSVVFPELVEGYAPTKRVLCETFCEGVPIMEFVRDHKGDSELLRNLCIEAIKAICQMIFLDNFTHGDLHPGNVLITKDYKFVLLDVGITTVHSDADHRLVSDVLAAFVRKDGRKAGRYMIDNSNARLEAVGDRAIDEEQFIDKIELLTIAASGKNYFMEKLGTYITYICNSAATHHVMLNQAFISSALAVKVQEGIGLALDPSVQICKVAIPIILEGERKHGRVQERAKELVGIDRLLDWWNSVTTPA